MTRDAWASILAKEEADDTVRLVVDQEEIEIVLQRLRDRTVSHEVIIHTKSGRIRLAN
ncbi:MAG TPA: hypothetical protein VN494_05625 [Patescibacteria group bacterium]|nr:hypothetical protein [Patescibacteria group bacterium]